jgi:hypothetical protein
LRLVAGARSRLVLEVAALAIAAGAAALLGASARGIVAVAAAAWLVTTTVARRLSPRRHAAEPSSADEPQPAVRLAEQSPAALERDAPARRPRTSILDPEPPRRWNVRELERVARRHDDDELEYLLVYLREFADADGLLPLDFDPLVRDSFGAAMPAPVAGATR